MGGTGLELNALSLNEIDPLRKSGISGGAESGALMEVLARKMGFSRVQAVLAMIESLTDIERAELKELL